MSRIGKRPIEVPAGVIVSLDPGRVTVSGPRGELRQQVPARMQIAQEENVLTVTRPTERGEDRALHGLTRTLIANMVEGVTSGFEKRLEIQGVGYRATMSGTDLELQVGYSHPVKIKPRQGDRVRGAGADAGRSCAATTSRSSARPPPRSAASARPSRTRARASDTRASSCAARSGRARNGEAHRTRVASSPPSPCTREGPRHRRASAPRGLPLEQGHLRPARRRRRRQDARRILVDESAEDVQGRQDRAGDRGRQAARASCKGRRRRRRRVRPWRLPVPRPRQSARRGRT